MIRHCLVMQTYCDKGPHTLLTSDVFKPNQKAELSNQTWANNSNCEANHSNRISANSMHMPIAFSLGFPFKFSAKRSNNLSSSVYQYYK